MQIPSMPFRVLVLAEFLPKTVETHYQKPRQVDPSSLDQLMRSFNISVDIPVPKELCPAGDLSLSFQQIKDFKPDKILANNPYLHNILDARTFAQEARSNGLSEAHVLDRLNTWPDLPIVFGPAQKKTETAASKVIDDILSMVALPETGAISPATGQTTISQIDLLLKKILQHIFSFPDFREIESVWRGLRGLMQLEGVSSDIVFLTAPVSQESLEETLNRLTTDLIEGLPSLCLIDLPFDNSPRSLDLLEKVGRFSETLLVPTLCWIKPLFFHIDGWQDLGRLPYIPHHLEGPVYAKWRRITTSSSARWLAVACNRFLLRYKYGPENNPGAVSFEENDELWASPVWAGGNLICKSLLKTGWPTGFTKWQDIRLEGLPLAATGDGKQLSTEVLLDQDRTDQFIRAGIIPLVSPKDRDIAFFPAETAVAGNSFSYQLFLARITQFIFWCKDNFSGAPASADLEQALKKAFTLFWEKSGHPVPTDLDISVSTPGPEDSPVVKISVAPPGSISHARDRVELEFSW